MSNEKTGTAATASRGLQPTDNPLDFVRPSGAKRSSSRTVSSLCISTICLLFDGIIASRDGIPLIEQGMIIGAIGC